MKSAAIVGAVLLAGTAAAAGPTAAQARGPAGGEVPGTIALPDPSSPFVAFDIWVKAGSQNDPEGKEGLAALTAELLSSAGTEELAYEEILTKLYPMATGYGSSVDKEMTVFRGVVHRDNLEAYYALLKDALLAPGFRPEDFERVKTRTLNYLERGRRFARDEELTKELLYWMAYRGTPYEHPEEGYVSSIRSITLDDVKDFYARYYVRNNIVVGIAGGYPEGFAERVRRDFDALPERDVPVVPRPEPRTPDGVHVLLVEKRTDASPISIGFPTSLVRSDPDFHAMMVANSWFGEHRNSFSHLYQVIRERRGMNYGDYSYIEAFPRGYSTQVPPVNVARRSHLFEIWIRPISLTEPGNLHDRTLFATRAALRELKKLVDEGLDPETVEKTKGFLRNYTVNWGSTLSRRLAYAVDDAFYGIGGDGFLAGLRPGLEKVTPEEVNAAIRRHLQYENLWIAIVTQDAEAFKQKLLSGEPTPITYAGERPAELLAEDREIAAFPIPVRPENITIVHINQVFE